MLSQLVSSENRLLRLSASSVLPAGFHVRLAQIGAEARALQLVGGAFEYVLGLSAGADEAAVRALFAEWVALVSSAEEQRE